MQKNILGISAFYHDSAAALVVDGVLVAASQEERFTRKKHDPAFPAGAIRFCLESQQLKLSDIDYIVFYEKPMIKFERLLETYLSYAPQGLPSFLKAMPVWLKEKLLLKSTLKKELAALEGIKIKELPPLMFTGHHQSHAASAFFPSPYAEAAVLCVDGVGEWASTSVWMGKGNTLDPLLEINFPHSLGLLYSAFTYYTGFRVNSGEYKLMGLAPYGEPVYADLIREHLIDVKEDGSYRLNMEYFNYATGLTMTSKKFHTLFGGPPRKPESELTKKEMDIARSIQVVTEEIVLKIARFVKEKTGADYLCLAGGVALNCVANGKLLRENLFKDIWIQPAAGDAGGAAGAAYSIWYEYLGRPRNADGEHDDTGGSYLGPAFDRQEITTYLDGINAPYRELSDDAMISEVAAILAGEHVIGWFQGKMEFGPRALGARSIIGDARSTKMQSIMNLKIKYRESFRPFAPIVRSEEVSNWFDIDRKSPYMLLVADVKKDKQIEMSEDQQQLFGIEKLNIPRSQIPAVTHVDYSARIQTVHKETNPKLWKLFVAFQELTGCPVLINTSFNVRGEPIVCTPEDAYRCFMRTEMDYLIMENCILTKEDQPAKEKDESWKEEFELD